MKKVYLGLAIAGLLAGCASTSDTASAKKETNAATAATSSVVIKSSASSLINDPQLTAFRSNSGKSDFWRKEADKNNGKGDVGSSKDSAFDDEGSARIRFISSSDDFSSVPGLSQTVEGLKPNTDYVLSFYLSDKKGANSVSEVLAGATGADGKELGESVIHVSQLSNSPVGEVKKSFRQAQVEFNSGDNTSATIYTRMRITDASAINMDGDIGKQTEVRVDEFALTKK
ncbi:alginate lyase precursor [Vibrio sp. JCM 19236]|uniref:hypothetical protein n=1 Tax=Vibrio ishigakensis TaxID=1481914 RepID=UPI000591914D|nr:hypothetical protein [Vibrio ishigakensis]GAM67053.1 alginate lyase precursor [Vibrio sp. JCM 19236]